MSRMKALIEDIKRTYPKGTRVHLVRMGSDPQPVPEGIDGTVRIVDDMGTIHVDWDNGRSLGLILGEDSFCKI